MGPLNPEAILALLIPICAILMPVGLVGVAKYFGLKKHELELEAQLQGRDIDARLRALEQTVGLLAADRMAQGPAAAAPVPASASGAGSRFAELAAAGQLAGPSATGSGAGQHDDPLAPAAPSRTR